MHYSASSQPRRTKIVATIGPASDSPQTMADMMNAGCDVFRISLAHDPVDVNLERMSRAREVAAELNHNLAVLVDLPGPKLRLEGIDTPLFFDVGQILEVSATDSSNSLWVDYPTLLEDLDPGDTVAFGDGMITAIVRSVTSDRVSLESTSAGVLQGRPGFHIPSEKNRVESPTPRDLEMLAAFVEADVDMVALSFVRTAHDLRRLALPSHPDGPMLIAKIETRVALDNLIPIIAQSGAVMVARGDLGVDLPPSAVPHVQKDIIRLCINSGRPVITATQMLESMIKAPRPTRAEASDVANAVLDGSSALMLSAETAIGVDPARVVGTMSDIARVADSSAGWEKLNELPIRESSLTSHVPLDDEVTDAISLAAYRLAQVSNASALLCVTRTGFTARAIARFRPSASVFAFTPNPRTLRQLSLSWGVTSFLLPDNISLLDASSWVANEALSRNLVRPGDTVVVVSGSNRRQGRVADTLQLLRL